MSRGHNAIWCVDSPGIWRHGPWSLVADSEVWQLLLTDGDRVTRVVAERVHREGRHRVWLEPDSRQGGGLVLAG